MCWYGEVHKLPPGDRSSAHQLAYLLSAGRKATWRHVDADSVLLWEYDSTGILFDFGRGAPVKTLKWMISFASEEFILNGRFASFNCSLALSSCCLNVPVIQSYFVFHTDHRSAIRQEGVLR